MTWLFRTPMAVVRSYVAMMPRLHAEDSLKAAERVGVGSGVFKLQSQRSIVRGWQKIASGGYRGGSGLKPKTGDLAALGIGIRQVPAPTHG